jgi:transcriptional regulator with GAF, ATPase, and Fis domain
LSPAARSGDPRSAAADLVIRFRGWTRRVRLGADPVVLGSDPECDVWIPDRGLSARHCRIVWDTKAGGWTVEDLGGDSGTRVDGRLAGQRAELQPGAHVEIGSTLVQLETRPAGAAVLSGEPGRDARHVDLLLRTIGELYATEELNGLLRTIVDRSILVAGGERGALLLAGPDGALEVGVARDAEGRDLAPEHVLTRSLPARALETQRPIVLTDTEAPEQASETPRSVAQGGLRSVLCVPLPGAGSPLGVLYVDARRPAGSFGPADLAVFEALATHGALALERARLLEEKSRRDADARKRLEAENTSFRAQLEGQEPLGASDAMQRVLQMIAKLAASDATVCLTGETGTGKEVLARHLHALSPRARGPFVLVDCGAVPEGLVESELFGHVKGAFTGASRSRPGRFREAEGGTLFLDEIGELPLHLQPKLLRVLQERSVQPVGAGDRVPVDVRILCATHQDLERAVAEGRFREDLYYRMGLLAIPVPPLRQRPEDIPLLADHFLARYTAAYGIGLTGFTREARQVLLDHAWPGNVRELQHRVQRSVLLAGPPFVRRRDLGLDEAAAEGLPSLQEARAAVVERFERAYFEQALRSAGGNVSRAAELAGISRQFCQRLLRRHGIERRRFIE